MFFSCLVVLLASALADDCSGSLAQSDRDVILDAHNKMRSSIALGEYHALGKTFPSAANMQKMEWQCELENDAQTWADKCDFAHSNSDTSGENLYIYWSWKEVSPSSVSQASCDSWSEEFHLHGLNSTTMSWDQMASGHATQMAWATSSQLGCGIALCGSEKKEALVVCHYREMGNIMDAAIYIEGAACSSCPDHAPLCEDETGLCIRE